MKAVYLSQPGIVNALGNRIDQVRKHLYAGNTKGMVMRKDLITGESVRVGAVTGSLPPIPEEHKAFASRNVQILCAALVQIRPRIEQVISRYGRHRVGIVLGGSTSGSTEGMQALQAKLETGHFPDGYDYRCQEMAAPSEFLRRYLNLAGPAFTVSTACTASAKALASAHRLLHNRVCDAVIVGGVDSLCGLTLNGFDALGAVSSQLCLPFSANRCGINIGEGAALFVMTREPGPVALLSVGESSDAYHISAPDPEGKGAQQAIEQGLSQAGITPDAVDYVNLHGTATLQNDAMEARVVHRVLGQDIPASSTKPLVGHLLGAAGATEAAFCWMLLAEPETAPLPPHVYDGVPDTELPPLALTTHKETAQCKVTLSHSFAFGGSNACVVMRRG